MGELIDLNPRTIVDSDIPAAIARDTETAAAIAAHAAASDPHSQYLVQSEGDARYNYKSSTAFKIIAGPLNFPANTWTSIGTFAGFPHGVQGKPSAIVVALSFTFNTASPWQQACCAAMLGCIWWQPATVGDLGTKVWLEIHNQTGHYISVRSGKFSQDVREIFVNPEALISIPSAGELYAEILRLI